MCARTGAGLQDSTLLLPVVNASLSDMYAALQLQPVTCAAGYSGVACISCARGYYRLDESCFKCPKGAAGLIVAEVAVIVALVGVGVFLRRHRVNTAMISIGLDFLQIMSIFTSLNFQWPAGLKTLFQLSSASTFNTQVLAPECSVSGWSFEAKYARLRG